MLVENEMSKTEYTKALKKAAREKWERVFKMQLEIKGFYEVAVSQDSVLELLDGEFVRELKFHSIRKWRFDFVFQDKVAVEIEGGVWTRGRHTRGAGFIADCEKYNSAVAMGWRVFRFPSQMIEDGTAIKFLINEVWN